MILMYHNIAPIANESSVSVSAFIRQMDMLKGKRVVYLDDYDPAAPDQVVITFDDGYKGVFDHAFPILKDFGYPFELFIVGDYYDWANAGHKDFLNREELLKLTAGGGRLQYHSKTHPHIESVKDKKKLLREITVPDDLKALDDKSFNWFAYPYCTYNNKILKAVKKYYAGARSGKGLGGDDRYTLDSIRMDDDVWLGKTDDREVSVSVVMPVYNGEKYIKEAIDSILNQTFSDFEFIIVNEYGSNEAVCKIIQEYAKKDKRIVIINNTEKLGISASLNIGMDRAKGKYIARMDADDISESTRFEKQVAFLDEHPEISILGVRPVIFGEADWQWPIETDPEYCRAMLLFFHPVVHPSVMIRKADFDKHGLRYNENYHATEDYDLWARASEYLKISNIDEPLLRYRMHKSNATHANNSTGLKLMSDIMLKLLEKIGVRVSAEEAEMLMLQYKVDVPGYEEGEQILDKLDLLLKKILFANGDNGFYQIPALFKVLHRRFTHQLDSIKWRLSGSNREKLEEYGKRALFSKPDFYRQIYFKITEPPLISVVIPCYKSDEYIMEALWSILDQTYGNFEVLIVTEKNSSDKAPDIAALFHDPRVRVAQNNGKKGLAASLNYGISEAKGKYIARMDADDISFPDRFEKQVNYLENNPDISICGGGQQYFGTSGWIHMPASSHEQIKANLLFRCDICHTTLMFNRQDFVSKNLFFKTEQAMEDYELWCRAVWEVKFYNFPEILGLYRKHAKSITSQKLDEYDDMGHAVIEETLSKLDIHIGKEDLILLSGWVNPFDQVYGTEKTELLKRKKHLLSEIWEQNGKKGLYSKQELMNALNDRWAWASGSGTWFDEKPADTIIKTSEKPPFKRRIRSFIKRLLRPMYLYIKKRTVDLINKNIADARWAIHQRTEAIEDQIRDARLATHQRTEELEDKIRDARFAIHQRTEELEEQIRDARLATHKRTEEIRADINDAGSIVRQSIEEIKADINDTGLAVRRNIESVRERVESAELINLKGMDEIKAEVENIRLAGIRSTEEIKADIKDTGVAAHRSIEEVREWVENVRLICLKSMEEIRAEVENLKLIGTQSAEEIKGIKIAGLKSDEEIRYQIDEARLATDRSIEGVREQIQSAGLINLKGMEEIRAEVESIKSADLQSMESVKGELESVRLLTRQLIEETKGEITELKELVSRLSNRQENLSESLTVGFDGQNTAVKRNEEEVLRVLDERLWKAEKEILRVMDARIWESEKVVTNFYFLYMKELARVSALDDSDRIFIFGTHFFQNLGDHAQTYCIIKWCSKYYPEHKVFTLNSAPDDNFDLYPILFAIREKLKPRDMIFVQGGCRLTDNYNNELAICKAVINVFHDKAVTLFPQSILFHDQNNFDDTAKAFAKHPNIFIMLRDPISYTKAVEKFQNAVSAAVPDIVHSLIGTYYFDNKDERKGIMLCKRPDDKEAKITGDEISAVIPAIRAEFGGVDISDTDIDASSEQITAYTKFYLDEFIKKFAGYKAVITDRLHGLIFSLIANTPVIVLPTEGNKVKNALAWYKESLDFKDYVHYCDNLDELPDTLKYIYSLDLEYKLPAYFNDKYFSKLFEAIEAHK
jgi:glycosyltransferase involved in cell wall biosynthesis/exopolysaccharide biosynthesis predicted pyruvyltransferase EpsI